MTRMLVVLALLLAWCVASNLAREISVSSSSLNRLSKRIRSDSSSIDHDEEEELEWLRERNARHRALVNSGGQAVLDSDETSALDEFYDALGGNSGSGWKWNKDYALYGVPWNFTKTRDGSSYMQDPCHFRWQGIHCNCNVTHDQDLVQYYYDAESDQHYVYPCRIDKIALIQLGLKGPFPQKAAAKMLHLTHLRLVSNAISGPLSSFCGLSANLITLGLVYNRISSTIPSCLGKYTDLRLLSLFTNKLTGNLSAVCHLSSKLTLLNFEYNSLADTIPSCLGKFTSMKTLLLVKNLLVGPLTPLCNLPSVFELDMKYNLLTGYVPSCIGGFGALTFLSLANNALSPSPIPSFLSKLTKLKALDLGSNAFTSTLPSFIANFHALQELSFANNSLTGGLDALCGLPRNITSNIELNNNKLTSTLPSCLLTFSALKFCQLGSNKLSGSIPMIDNPQLDSLAEFSLDHNQLTGLIPSQFKNLTFLTQILLNDNMFGWNKALNTFSSLQQPDFVDPQQTELTFIDISNNPFTGHLSPSFFYLPKLEYFSAAVMCLDGGTLPEAICEAKNLKYLVLSGLTSHANCREKLFQNLTFLDSTFLHINIDGSNPNSFMSGTIPSCIFTMPNLTSFHATGGGFTGSFPSHTSSPLKHLALSHNLLTGTVPSSIWQLNGLELLDLSKNKFRGTCQALQDNPSIQDNVTVIKFDVNRFSGNISNNLVNIRKGNVDVLDGNLFACTPHLGQLAMFNSDPNFPKNDPFYHIYMCGSCKLDASMDMAAIVFGIFFFIIAIYVYGGTRDESKLVKGSWRHRVATYMSRVGDWHAITRRDLDLGLHDRLLYVFRFIDLLATFRRNVGYVTAFHVFLLMPIYISLSSDPSIRTMFDVKGWVTTASFLHGQTATIVLFVFWFVLLVYMSRLPVFHRLGGENDPKLAEIREKRAAVKNINVRLVLIIRQLFIMFCSSIVMVFANVYYCVSVSETIMLIAALKVAWNWIASPWMLRTSLFRFGLTKLQIGDETFFAIILYTANNFLIPIFAVLITSSNCFYHFFTSSEMLTSTIVFPKKVIPNYDGSILTIPALTQVTAYTPPAFYNYQCSSDVLVKYTPVFVIMYVFMSLSYVVMDVGMRYVCFPEATIEEEEAHFEQREAQKNGIANEKNQQEDTNSSQGQDAFAWHPWMRHLVLKRVLSKMLLTPYERIELAQKSSSSNNSSAMQAEASFRPTSPSSNSIIAAPSVAEAFDTMITIDAKGKVFMRQFRPKLFLINQVTNLLLLFTFGATSPLLSLVIVTAMVSHTMHVTFVIGRFVHNEHKLEERGKIKPEDRIGGIDQLDDECRSFSFRFLFNTRWLLLSLSSAFYAFFLIDTYGDAYGYQNGKGVFFLMLLTPVLIFLLERIAAQFGYEVSAPPLPLSRFVHKRKVTELGVEMEEQVTSTTNQAAAAAAAAATRNPLSSLATAAAINEHDDDDDDIPSKEHDASSQSFCSTISTINSVKVRPIRHKESIGGANAATLIALDAKLTM